jgi:hypothetical protein
MLEYYQVLEPEFKERTMNRTIESIVLDRKLMDFTKSNAWGYVGFEANLGPGSPAATRAVGRITNELDQSLIEEAQRISDYAVRDAHCFRQSGKLYIEVTWDIESQDYDEDKNQLATMCSALVEIGEGEVFVYKHSTGVTVVG